MLGERVVAKPPENHSFPVVTDPFLPSACSDGVAIFGGCAEQLELRGILQSSHSGLMNGATSASVAIIIIYAAVKTKARIEHFLEQN